MNKNMQLFWAVLTGGFAVFDLHNYIQTGSLISLGFGILMSYFGYKNFDAYFTLRKES